MRNDPGTEDSDSVDNAVVKWVDTGWHGQCSDETSDEVGRVTETRRATNCYVRFKSSPALIRFLRIKHRL